MDNINGIDNNVYYNNIERDNELNIRISQRNVPSSNLKPQFSQRPLSSKYELFPIFDRRPKPTVPIKCEPIFNPANTFNPGTAQAPWSGFSTNINTESQLRNQYFALQKNDQAEYIPSSSSQLYNNKVIGNNVKQRFPGLFEKPNLASFNPNKDEIGYLLFNNGTRQQYKNVKTNLNNMELPNEILDLNKESKEN